MNCCSGNPPVDRRVPHYAWIVLALVVLSVFCALGLGRFGYSMVLPAMQQSLGLTNSQTGALQSWNLLGYMLAAAGSGVLASHIGPRPVIAGSLLLLGAAMAATAMAATFGQLAAARFLAGVGGAGANVSAMGLLGAWFAARRRGTAAGVGVAGSSLALAATGLSVPAVLARFAPDAGWRVCWWAFAGVAAVAGIAVAAAARNRPSDLGLSPVGSAPGAAGPQGERGRMADVWRSGRLWYLAGVYLMFGFSYIIYSTFFVRHMVRDGGLTTAEAGRLWFAIGVVSIPSGLVWGAVSDRFGRGRTLAAIFTMQVASFALLGSSIASPAVWSSGALFALTAWSIPAVIAALCADEFGPRLAPAALGLVTVVFGLGQTLGPWTAGLLADRTGSFSAAFLAASAVAAVGAVLAGLLRER